LIGAAGDAPGGALAAAVGAVEQMMGKAAIWDELKDRVEDNAFRLSVGQQQRVCIARTLANAPSVILMDEPAAALDPSSASKVEASINSSRGDYTVMIVTHNLQQAMRVSDYTACLFLGEVVEFGETPQIFSNPQRSEMREYIAGRFG
jgi:phosphate transport system ATP-binding protein